MSAWGIALVAVGALLCVAVWVRHLLNSYPRRDDNEMWEP